MSANRFFFGYRSENYGKIVLNLDQVDFVEVAADGSAVIHFSGERMPLPVPRETAEQLIALMRQQIALGSALW